MTFAHLALPGSTILIVLAGFPLLYLANSFTPWSRGLFVRFDRGSRRSFFLSIHVLHWATTLCALLMLGRRGYSAVDLGLNVQQAAWGVAAFLILGFILANARNDAPSSPSALDGQAQVPAHMRILGLLSPRGRIERVEFVLVCLTAGICEEVLYRGFGIVALKSHGYATWIALLLPAISFALIHGRAAFSPMGLYWIVKGVFYGALFVWTGSLVLVILMHAFWDLAILLRKDRGA